MAKDSKGNTQSGEFDAAGPDPALIKARKRQMNRAWNEATVGEGFFLPLSLITRPKRTLVLGLGLLAFVFTIGGLWNVAGGFLSGDSGTDPNLADPASIGGAVGEDAQTDRWCPTRNSTAGGRRGVRQNLQGWLMAAALVGAIVAGVLNVPLWLYFVGLVIVLAVIGLVLNEEQKR
jgi:hypothetical protein